MDQEKNKRIAKEWYEVSWTKGSNDFYETYLDDDFTADLFGQQLSRTEYILQDQEFSKAFRDSKRIVADQIAEDDKVVTIILWTAIHVADVQGIPASGKPINIKGMAVDHFKNGKIIKHYRLFDTAQILKRHVVRGQVRADISRDLHDNIGSTLGSISYYSEMAQQLPAEMQSQQKMLLQKIQEASHELVDEMSDIVWAINPSNDSFEKLTIRMRNYAADLFATGNIEFSFDTKDVSESIRLSMEQRKNIFLVFKEAVYNALKYACCSNFNAAFHQTTRTLIFEMQDNGKGFDVNHSGSYNGNGISNMKQRAKEIDAEFSMHSKAGNGTQIRFELPIKQ